MQAVELDVSTFGDSANETQCPIAAVGEQQQDVGGGVVLTELLVGTSGSAFGQDRTPNTSSESNTSPVVLNESCTASPPVFAGPSASPKDASAGRCNRRATPPSSLPQPNRPVELRCAVVIAGVIQQEQALAPQHECGLVLHVCCTRCLGGRGRPGK